MLQINWNNWLIEEIIDLALREDLFFGDITTDSIINDSSESTAYITAKSPGIIAGLPLAEKIFKKVDPQLQITFLKTDGDFVSPGDHLIVVRGKTKSILRAERTVLNFLQSLSGIATKTWNMKKIIQDLPVRLTDTRKTTPGMRILEKYAVRIGGGHNHRFGLFDAVLIKDNHITAAGSISQAVRLARQNLPHTVKIEVETETLDQVKEALNAGADIIMLDNMSLENIHKAVAIINKRAIVEVSGGVTEQNIRQIALAGVDIISVGALTHSAKALDISLNINPEKISNG